MFSTFPKSKNLNQSTFIERQIDLDPLGYTDKNALQLAQIPCNTTSCTLYVTENFGS